MRYLEVFSCRKAMLTIWIILSPNIVPILYSSKYSRWNINIKLILALHFKYFQSNINRHWIKIVFQLKKKEICGATIKLRILAYSAQLCFLVPNMLWNKCFNHKSLIMCHHSFFISLNLYLFWRFMKIIALDSNRA